MTLANVVFFMFFTQSYPPLKLLFFYTRCMSHEICHGIVAPSSSPKFSQDLPMLLPAMLIHVSNNQPAIFPTEPKTCGRPEQPPNSTMLAEDFGVGSSVEYACDDGYLLVGPTVRTCLDTGFFDEFPPVCKREYRTERRYCSFELLVFPRSGEYLVLFRATDLIKY